MAAPAPMVSISDVNADADVVGVVMKKGVGALNDAFGNVDVDVNGNGNVDTKTNSESLSSDVVDTVKEVTVEEVIVVNVDAAEKPRDVGDVVELLASPALPVPESSLSNGDGVLSINDDVVETQASVVEDGTVVETTTVTGDATLDTPKDGAEDNSANAATTTIPTTIADEATADTIAAPTPADTAIPPTITTDDDTTTTTAIATTIPTSPPPITPETHDVVITIPSEPITSLADNPPSTEELESVEPNKNNNVISGGGDIDEASLGKGENGREVEAEGDVEEKREEGEVGLLVVEPKAVESEPASTPLVDEAVPETAITEEAVIEVVVPQVESEVALVVVDVDEAKPLVVEELSETIKDDEDNKGEGEVELLAETVVEPVLVTATDAVPQSEAAVEVKAESESEVAAVEEEGEPQVEVDSESSRVVVDVVESVVQVETVDESKAEVEPESTLADLEEPSIVSELATAGEIKVDVVQEAQPVEPEPIPSELAASPTTPPVDEVKEVSIAEVITPEVPSIEATLGEVNVPEPIADAATQPESPPTQEPETAPVVDVVSSVETTVSDVPVLEATIPSEAQLTPEATLSEAIIEDTKPIEIEIETDDAPVKSTEPEVMSVPAEIVPDVVVALPTEEAIKPVEEVGEVKLSEEIQATEEALSTTEVEPGTAPIVQAEDDQPAADEDEPAIEEPEVVVDEAKPVDEAVKIVEETIEPIEIKHVVADINPLGEDAHVVEEAGAGVSVPEEPLQEVDIEPIHITSVVAEIKPEVEEEQPLVVTEEVKLVKVESEEVPKEAEPEPSVEESVKPVETPVEAVVDDAAHAGVAVSTKEEITPTEVPPVEEVPQSQPTEEDVTPSVPETAPEDTVKETLLVDDTAKPSEPEEAVEVKPYTEEATSANPAEHIQEDAELSASDKPVEIVEEDSKAAEGPEPTLLKELEDVTPAAGTEVPSSDVDTKELTLSVPAEAAGPEEVAAVEIIQEPLITPKDESTEEDPVQATIDLEVQASDDVVPDVEEVVPASVALIEPVVAAESDATTKPAEEPSVSVEAAVAVQADDDVVNADDPSTSSEATTATEAPTDAIEEVKSVDDVTPAPEILEEVPSGDPTSAKGDVTPEAAVDVDDSTIPVEEEMIFAPPEEIKSPKALREEHTPSSPLIVEPEPDNATTLEEVTDAPEPSTQDAPVERPKSPWTPSYSVVQVGSGVQASEPVGEVAAVASIEAASPPESNLIAPEPVRPKSPWTPSYSTTVQGSPSRSPTPEPETPAIIEHTDEKSTVPEEPVDATDLTEADNAATETIAIEPEIAAPPVGAPVQIIEPQPSLAVGTEVQQETIERPKSPWTPSYSVTTQGSPLVESKSISLPDALEPAPVETTPSIEAEIPAVPEVVVDTEPLTVVEEDSPTFVAPTLEVTELPTLPESAHDEDPPSAPEAPETSDVVSPSLHITLADASSSIESPPEEVILSNVPPVHQLSRSQSKESLTPKDIPERPKSPWTPSYSVTLQGSPHLEVQTLADEPTIADTVLVEEPPVDSSSGPSTEIPAEALNVDSSPAPIERPNSPWTPSYSVTRQGSVPPSPQPSDRALDVQDTADSSSTEPTEENATSEPDSSPLAVDNVEVQSNDVVLEATPIPEIKLVDVIVEEKTTPEVELDSTQELSTSAQLPAEEPSQIAIDPPTITVDGTGTPREEQPESQVFPSAVDAGDDKKPVVPRLDTVDEQLELDTTPATLDPSIRGRKRLESTSSSRFFPGGWFSSSPTIEGRASLENAQGEFTPSKSPIDMSGTTAPATTPVDGLAEDEEKRSRWCTIM